MIEPVENCIVAVAAFCIVVLPLNHTSKTLVRDVDPVIAKVAAYIPVATLLPVTTYTLFVPTLVPISKDKARALPDGAVLLAEPEKRLTWIALVPIDGISRNRPRT